jgi:NADPH:quinone reductase
VLDATNGRGVDLVLELVGGTYLSEDIAACAVGGRIVLVGLMAGAEANVDLGLVLRKRLSLRGTILRSRPIEEKIAISRAFAKHVVPLLERGVVRPVVGGVLPLAEAKTAHEMTERNETFGKMVLTI